jgi:hypothetical protein
VAEGRFTARKDVEREVERLLGTNDVALPRLLRFFQEYFEYPRATDVFKDARPMGLSQAVYRIEDADAFVRWILREDRDVLKRLLTEDRYFMGTDVLANVPNHVRRLLVCRLRFSKGHHVVLRVEDHADAAPCGQACRHVDAPGVAPGFF